MAFKLFDAHCHLQVIAQASPLLPFERGAAAQWKFNTSNEQKELIPSMPWTL